MAIKYGRPIEARLAPVEAKNVSKPATRLIARGSGELPPRR